MKLNQWLTLKVSMPRGLAILVALAVVAAALVLPSVSAQSSLPGEILKGAAIGLAVNQFSGELNKLINNATTTNKFPVTAATKVVPIVNVGGGRYVGAAQVMGPKSSVDKVNACVELTGSFIGKQFRARILIPIDSIKNMKRVEGVGVAAVIEARL